MECKSKDGVVALKGTARINRYIMECKSAYIRPKSFVMPELIDTLWNVNNSCHCLHSGEGCELIDTLWNVNKQR